MSVVRLHGEEAIEYAKEHNLTLHREATANEPAKHFLQPDEAAEIVKEDPELIWLEVEADVNTAGHE